VSGKASTFSSAVEETIHRLDQFGVPYMIVGSIAASYYGEPRLTKDLDIVLDVPTDKLSQFDHAFSEASFYVPPKDILADELTRRGRFNLIHLESGVKIDVVVRRNGLHAIEEFKRRQQVELWPGLKAYMASPEDVILKKLEYYREGQSQKHLTDIRGMMASWQLDRSYIESWVSRLGLGAEWNQVKAS